MTGIPPTPKMVRDLEEDRQVLKANGSMLPLKLAYEFLPLPLKHDWETHPLTEYWVQRPEGQVNAVFIRLDGNYCRFLFYKDGKASTKQFPVGQYGILGKLIPEKLILKSILKTSRLPSKKRVRSAVDTEDGTTPDVAKKAKRTSPSTFKVDPDAVKARNAEMFVNVFSLSEDDFILLRDRVMSRTNRDNLKPDEPDDMPQAKAKRFKRI
jgi:hypothetical protein